MANLDTDELLQGVIEISGQPGPGVDTDNPINPDPGTELTNCSSVWDFDE